MNVKNSTKETYQFSFRCYFPSDDGSRYNNHYQRMALKDIPKWIEAYKFTHPDCLSICVKIWLTERDAFDDDVE